MGVFHLAHFLMCTPFIVFPERGIGPGLQFAPTSTSDAILVNTMNGVTFLYFVLIFFRIFPLGPFIYYVITFLGFLDPPPPLRNHVFSTENNKKLAFSDPLTMWDLCSIH